MLRRWRSRRSADDRAAAVVELAYALAAELRAGRPPGAALAVVAEAGGPLAAPLREVAAVTQAGVPVAAELRRLAEVPGAEALQALAVVWEVTEEHGGPVAEVLDRLGEALDAEAAARRSLQAALAGPRATMLLLLALPCLGIALGESTGAHPLSLLVHRPLGWTLLAAAVVLDAIGAAWTRRLLRGAMRA
jgi:tight adherence protein B